MQNAKRVGLIIGGLGLLLCIPLFWVKSEDSFMLSLAIIFVLTVLIATTIMFLVYYFNDFKIHPQYRREMKTMSAYFFGALALGFVMALIFGGTDPVMKGDGTLYDNKASLLFIGTIIWTAFIMLITSFVYSLIPLFKK